MDYELRVKEIPLETFILTGKIYDKNIINNLINCVKKIKDDRLSFKTHVKGLFTGFQALVNNEYFNQFLQLIQPQIQLIYQDSFKITDAWGNICKQNEEITEHKHGDNVFCGILYLTAGGPGTYFKQYDLTIDEEIGKYVLFHPNLLHSVKKIQKNIERITVAFNMDEIKKWDNLEDIKWVNKNEI